MAAHRLAIGVAQQRGAVVDLRRQLAGERLTLGQQREPVAEGGAILWSGKAEKIGRTVLVGISVRERGVQGDARRPETRAADFNGQRPGIDARNELDRRRSVRILLSHSGNPSAPALLKDTYGNIGGLQHPVIFRAKAQKYA